MQDHSYKLTSDVTGFLPLPSGASYKRPSQGGQSLRD
jgi:hypothetical protein